MQLVFKFKKEDLEKVKEALLKDDLASRGSISFKEGRAIGLEDYYLLYSGTEEQCKRVEELLKELSEKLENEKKEEIIEKIKKDEEKALEGFGSIFG